MFGLKTFYTNIVFLFLKDIFMCFLIFFMCFFSEQSLSAQTVTDIEGNTYKTVTIGTQTWLAENLKTTNFNNNTPIPLVTEKGEWDSLITPAYCWYQNDDSLYKNIYGALYNWYAVNTGNLCPEGWRVPSADDWDTLVAFLGGNYLAGGALKVMGTEIWKTPNTGATNESGFTALPGGTKVLGNGFTNLSNSGHWWTATEFKDERSCSRILLYYTNVIYKDFNNKKNGNSVRCVKD